MVVRLAARSSCSIVGILVFGSSQANNVKWIDLATEALYLGAAAVGLNILLGYTGLLVARPRRLPDRRGLRRRGVRPRADAGSRGCRRSCRPTARGSACRSPSSIGALMGTVLALMCCHLKGFYLTVVTLAFGVFLPVPQRGGQRAARRLELGAPSSTSPIPGTPSWPATTRAPASTTSLPSSCSSLSFVTWNLIAQSLGSGLHGHPRVGAGRHTSAASTPTGPKCRPSRCRPASSRSRDGWRPSATCRCSPAGRGDVQNQSFRLVIMVVVGGMGTIAGPVIGAVALTFFFGLTFVQETFRNYMGLVFGVLGLVTVATAPEGTMGNIRKLVSQAKLRRTKRGEAHRDPAHPDRHRRAAPSPGPASTTRPSARTCPCSR